MSRQLVLGLHNLDCFLYYTQPTLLEIINTMNYLALITDRISLLAPTFFTTASLILFLWLCHRFFIVRNAKVGNEKMLARQLLMLCLTAASIIISILSLPVSDSTRNQLLVLIGIIISGIFAFSSTTIFTNLMAGMMLRVTKPFLTGDFVRVNDFFGRVTERGLLDTEIQTEDRQLVALPNSLLINSAISVIRSSGTVVSVNLSLGYDVHHAKIETLLLEAVANAELEEAFVQVLELGDDAITYKASGILIDVKKYLTAHSTLRKQILDTLHNNDIEIVSPSFVNQRRLNQGQRVIPEASIPSVINKETTSAEDVVFDKADLATEVEEKKALLKSKIKAFELELASADSTEKKRLKSLIKDSLIELGELKNTSLEETESDSTLTESAVVDSVVDSVDADTDNSAENSSITKPSIDKPQQ